MNHRVRVLKMGQCEVPGPEVYWMSHWQQWEMLYFWMVLVQIDHVLITSLQAYALRS